MWENPQPFCVCRGKHSGKGEKLLQKPSKTGQNRVFDCELGFCPVEKTKRSFFGGVPNVRLPPQPSVCGGEGRPPVRNRLKKPLKHDKMGENEPSGGRSAASGGRTWRNSMNWLDKLERKYSRFCIHNLDSPADRWAISWCMLWNCSSTLTSPCGWVWTGRRCWGARSGVCSAL